MLGTRHRVLVVEDDEMIGGTLVRALEASGYRAAWTASGREGVELSREVDLVLLDLGLPDLGGLEVCRLIRDRDELLPVIMLTARDADVDAVVGLAAGAVDYVRKPFSLAEVLARIAVHLRKRTIGGPDALVVGDLRIEQGARRVWVSGEEVQLRLKEFDLLWMLAEHAGQVVTRSQLMVDVWDEHWFGSTKTLDVTMASLRRRLGEGPGAPSRITVLRGVGYRFELP